MMNHQLLIKTILERSYELFAGKEIFSRCLDEDFRYTYGDFYDRVCKLANILKHLGIKKGDRVGTYAWNTHRHLELYYAITCSGAVLHTLNIRLFSEHLVHIINHAEDNVIFIDEDLLPRIEEIAPRLNSVKKYVILTDKEELPKTSLFPVFHYEKLMKDSPASFNFPELDENTPAALAYTSATTGMPKGVIYTHRSIYLHALTLCVPDAIGISERDVILPAVPMFHVFSWGFPFSAVFMGAKLVLPGQNLQPPTLCKLLEQESVTLIPGVPTIWINVYQHLESGVHYNLSSLRYLLNGGAPISKTLVENYDKNYGIKFLGTYGMTEASPVVLTCPLKSYMDEWEETQKYALQAKQGRLLPGLKGKIINDAGKEVSQDGREAGELLLQGPWIASEYYRDPGRSAEAFQDGWYHSNDIVTIDEEGYILVKDRVKDIIKSGGEWISSLELESKIMAHPAVTEAAVIGVPHQKWQERPVAFVVLKEEKRGTLSEAEVLSFLEDKVAKWWIPDQIIFIDEIPKTGVGKADKMHLREKSWPSFL